MTTTTQPLQLRAGAFYRTRTGKKVGPLKSFNMPGHLAADIDGESRVWRTHDGTHEFGLHSLDLVAEWTDTASPVHTVTSTRTEIRPGTYGRVTVGAHLTPGWIDIRWGAPGTTVEELRNAAATLLELAEGLDRIAQERNAR